MGNRGVRVDQDQPRLDVDGARRGGGCTKVLACLAALLFAGTIGACGGDSHDSPGAGGAGSSVGMNGGAGGNGGAGPSCTDVPAPGAPVGATVDFVPGVVVSTLAGSGASGRADGAGAAVSFDNPVSIALAPGGNLFVLEYDNEQVRQLTPAGVSSTVIAMGKLSQPFGIVAASNDVLYVDTDMDPQGSKSATSGTIWRIDVATQAATPVAPDIGRPRGIALLSDGRLALSDYRNNRIMLLDPQTGAVTTLAGSGCAGYADGQGTSAQFSTPYGLDVRADGTLVVADYGNHRLRTVGLDGTVGTLAGDGLNGLVDGDVSQARFFWPEDVAIDGSGAIYVSDHGNHRIRRLSQGRVQTLAGDGTAGYSDGAGNMAEFFGQEGIAVTPDGVTLYVADGTGGDTGPYHRVRAVSMAGTAP
jgi:sugar lactone lactonase YvrE